jgi:hypothetical protein
MKLIATLGTTSVNPDRLHLYKIEDKSYKEYFSFLALKRHFNIEDKNIIIIGTKETKNIQKEYIKNFEFIEVDADNFNEVFAKTLKTLKNKSIIDLTQSFKSLGYGAILSYSFSKSIGKEIKDIFYAQVQNNCNPSKNKCQFIFQSLKRYEEITDLVKEIEIFLTSWYVLSQKKEEFSKIHNNLLKISQKLLINDLDISENVIDIKKEIKVLKNNPSYEFIHNHLDKLENEIDNIKKTINNIEYLKLFKFSKLYFNKNLLLQSLTMLFESIGAFIEIKTKDNFKCKNKKGEFSKNDDKYKFRNCLKSKLSVIRYDKSLPEYLFRFIKIKNLKNLAKHFVKVDELRNSSAHVFINGKTDILDFKEEIKKELEFFEKIYEKA